ncbi:MAG: CRTAC1 family protein [Terriglobales bacterium]
MSFSRRNFLKSLSRTAIVLTFDQVLASAIPPRLFGQSKPADVASSLGVEFINVAREAGLKAKTIFGGEHKNKYLLETTGCGVAFYDFDQDGWLDIFLVNGTRLEGFPKDVAEPGCHLYKNNRDGTFTDVTAKSGINDITGWGQACCIGDYDNDGWDDLFVTYFGPNQLYKNNGNGTFTNVTEKAGLLQKGKARWNTGAAFLDYDRDGHLDLFVGNYIDLDLATAPVPESGPCLYKSIMVACGPPGMTGGKNLLYHNNGDGTFTDVSEKSGILETPSTYALGVLAADLDNDGWPDIYVANDSMPATLYKNKKNGTFEDVAIEAGCALSADGKPQAGMGVSAADYNSDGNLDVVKTNFAGDTPSLFKGMGGMTFEDVTFAAGLGVNTRFLGWGVGFFDFDNDSWPDILICNGHVYPEVEQLKTEAAYAQRKVLFKNLRNGKFEDISAQAGSGIMDPYPSRGCAFGDFDNDGDMDFVVNGVNLEPQLVRCDSKLKNNWIKIKCVGTKSNRTAIGTRLHCVTKGPDGKPHQQVDEVRSGGGYFAQSDLRIHFGLGEATSVELLEIRWPTGEMQKLTNLAANKLYVIKEGEATPQAQELKNFKAR